MNTLQVDKPVVMLSNTEKISSEASSKAKVLKKVEREKLTTKRAVELLLSGTLRSKVCRFCLHISSPLSELDQIMQIAGSGAMYKVKIRDIIASFHPYKVVDDPNIPNKICEKCLDKALQSYRFAQKCEQSERALRNCLEDVYGKLEKLDPLERTKKRGRQKLNPNHNVLYTENFFVIDYADPLHNLVNLGAESLTKETTMGEFECKKCWQLLPNLESLLNHENKHQKSMWYHCRLCGKSFSKKFHITRHLRQHEKGTLSIGNNDDNTETGFICKQCGFTSDNHYVHLQHLEKHKFKMVLEHLVARHMDKLCSVCLNKNSKLVDLTKVICLHGGYPELTGDRTLYNILGSTVPEMNIFRNYTGTKICEKCLDHALISYIFINKTHYIRDRLNVCVTKLLECLQKVNSEKKIFIEISQSSTVPVVEDFDENLLLEDNDVDETKLRVEELEGEFKKKYEEEINSENFDDIETKEEKSIEVWNKDSKLVNGYTNFNSSNLNEFLTFKSKDRPLVKLKPKVFCPVCNKHFISQYFLKRHVLKHVNKKVECKICFKVFNSKFHLLEHKKATHLLKLSNASSCQTCNRTFKSDRKRVLHEKCHFSKQCELCSKVFVTQNHFNNHMQRHAAKIIKSVQKSLQTCSFCEKRYPNYNELSVHVNKVHLQIKPYACDMCDKKYYTDYNLRNHKRVHSLHRKEQCVFCAKYFKCRRDLVVHIRKHIGNMPYKCVICTQKFYSELKMKGHMKKWHGGSFFCKLCRKVFMNKKGLRDHVNQAHSFF